MSTGQAGHVGQRDPRRASPTAERVLLACGAVGPPLFVLVFLVLGAIRAQYDASRHPVSSLSIGAHGWMQITNFLVTGTLLIAFAEGLRRRVGREGGGLWGPVLIALVGLGLAGAGVFTADPISGFPPGTPPTTDPPTLHGELHNLFSSLVFFGLPVACLVFARRLTRQGRRGRALYSIASGALFLVFFVLAGMGFAQNAPLVPVAGLLQRTTLIIGLAWLVTLAVELLRHPAPSAPEPHEGT